MTVTVGGFVVPSSLIDTFCVLCRSFDITMDGYFICSHSPVL